MPGSPRTARRNRHNVTCGHFALLRCTETTSKDREVAASHHVDTPHSGRPVTSVPVTPYTTSVDVNECGCLMCCGEPDHDRWNLITVVAARWGSVLASVFLASCSARWIRYQ